MKHIIVISLIFLSIPPLPQVIDLFISKVKYTLYFRDHLYSEFYCIFTSQFYTLRCFVFLINILSFSLKNYL